jgi:hypothetical protein
MGVRACGTEKIFLVVRSNQTKIGGLFLITLPYLPLTTGNFYQNIYLFQQNGVQQPLF